MSLGTEKTMLYTSSIGEHPKERATVLFPTYEDKRRLDKYIRGTHFEGIGQGMVAGIVGTIIIVMSFKYFDSLNLPDSNDEINPKAAQTAPKNPGEDIASNL